MIITDDDTRGVTLSKTALTVKEGESGTYTVVLDSEPTGDVTVTVGGATGDVSVDTSTDTGDQSTLTFTSTTWNTARTVTVKAADDDDAVADTVVTLTHAVSGADYGSSSVSAGSVAVTITESDTRGVTLSRTALTVKEGESGTYTVVLDSEPTGDVTVTVGGISGDVSVDTSTASGNQNTLTFTSTTWNTARTVTVSAATDEDAANDAVVTLTHAVSGADYGSSSVSAGSVAVTITEKDAATFGVTGPATVAEGAGKATYAVTLSAAPAADVTVKYATSDGTATAGSDYTSTSGTLTFTTTSWSTAQTVDVAITDDTVDDDGETFTVALSAPGTGSVLSASPSVITTITDDDDPAK